MGIITPFDRTTDPEAPDPGWVRWYSKDGDLYVRRSDGTVERIGGVLTETSGPTLLTFGAIADGQLLQRVGSLIQGFSFAGGNVVEVTVKADLPAPVGGVITLVPGLVYLFRAVINLGTDRIEASGSAALMGYDRSACGLITVNASPLLTFTGANVALRGLQLVNPGGQCFAYTGGVGTFFTLDDCVMINGAADSIAGPAGFTGTLIRNNQWQGSLGCFAGVTFGGVMSVLFMDTNGMLDLLDPTARYVELLPGLIVGSADLTSGLFSTAVGQTAIYVDPGIVPIIGGGITKCGFGGSGTMIGGIGQETPGWLIKTNPNVRDNTWAGNISLANNTQTTTIPGIGTWVEINTNVNWMLAPESERMSLFGGPGTGARLQMDGRIPGKFAVLFALVISSTSPNQDLEIRLRRYVAATMTDETVGFIIPAPYKSTPLAIDNPTLVSLELGDRLYLEIRNNTSTAALLVSRAALQAVFA